MPPCSRCDAVAVERIDYAGQHLCADHLRRYVEKRVKAEVRDQVDVHDGTLAVATSGGKDSLVCLKMAEMIFGPRRDVEIVAVTVDEGIEGYRAPGVRAAADLCKDLEIRHVVKRYEAEVDVTMDGLVGDGDLEGAPCSTCGVLRRRLLNEAARDVGADWLATGHNLDDVAQSVLMNVCRGDVRKLARLGPHRESKPGMVPRILPLRSIPEREVALYAHIVGLPVQFEACPHSDRALRGRFRSILHDLEADHPGTRHAILAFFDRVRPLLKDDVDDGEVAECPRCGGPSSGGPCRACELVEDLEAAKVGSR